MSPAALTAKSGVFCDVHYGKVQYIGIRAAKFCAAQPIRPLYSFVNEHAHEPENKKTNGQRSTGNAFSHFR